MSARRLLALVLVLQGAGPRTAGAEPVVVNDVSQLNPIAVEQVVTPKTVEELRDLIRLHHGPISIGGARHSMGGQIATEGSLLLDMRGLDRIVALSLEERRITVQAGITWRKIQEAIDPHGLSVQIMQSYANFTVGGSLSVNVHGRYVGQGPLISSVESMKVMLADGQLVTASRSENPDLFFGCIGGYGGLGVIVEATLDLTQNQKVAREVRKLPVKEYREFFLKAIRDSPKAVLHNGDLYPPAYDTVMAVTWSQTDRPLTIPDRLMPLDGRHWKDRAAQYGVSELPFGKELRADLLDPMRLRGSPVVWRNYEASYDAAEIEPASRARSTYVLQEYFVPVARFDDFVPRMASIFQRHRVNVLNVSIRHARQDPGSLLAWGKEESFAFVVYYKQGVTTADREEVGDWTRELIDAALALGGSYYLPYQLHATDEQFHRAYPRAEEFFALKRRVDSDYRFRNKLWDRYFPPAAAVAAGGPPAPRETERSEAQTFLTLPEWYIVYSADEYAAFVTRHRPSEFPFFSSVRQFWRIYGSVLHATRGRYPFNWGYHAMIGVIGASYTAEYAGRGVYEGTVGRLTEWLAQDAKETEEDRYIAAVAAEYAQFIHATPWYEFPFGEKIGPLWHLHDGPGTNPARVEERRLEFTGELAMKSAWGWLMRKATQAAYDPEDFVIQARTRALPAAALRAPRVRVLGQPDADTTLLSLPRYEPFTETVTALARQGVQFVDVAGNHTILMTVIAPQEWRGIGDAGQSVSEWEILTRTEEKRVAIAVSVERLHEVIPRLDRERVKIDHLYDY